MNNTIEQLNTKKGKKVWYRGGWGTEKPELAVFTGAEFDESRDEIVVGVNCDDGDSHWGYVYQIEFIE